MPASAVAGGKCTDPEVLDSPLRNYCGVGSGTAAFGMVAPWAYRQTFAGASRLEHTYLADAYPAKVHRDQEGWEPSAKEPVQLLAAAGWVPNHRKGPSSCSVFLTAATGLFAKGGFDNTNPPDFACSYD